MYMGQFGGRLFDCTLMIDEEAAHIETREARSVRRRDGFTPRLTSQMLI